MAKRKMNPKPRELPKVTERKKGPVGATQPTPQSRAASIEDPDDTEEIRPNLPSHNASPDNATDRAIIGKAIRRTSTPVTYLDYAAMWRAFQESPSIGHVQKETKMPRAIVARAIEMGWEDQQMPSLARRLADVRRAAQQIADYDLAAAMADNGKFIRGIKVKLQQAFGPRFDNFSIDKLQLKDMSIKDAKILTDLLNSLFRLEAFALREGEDVTTLRHEHSGNVNHTMGGSDHTEQEARAMGRISMLARKMNLAITEAEENIVEGEYEEGDPALDTSDYFEDSGDLDV